MEHRPGAVATQPDPLARRARGRESREREEGGGGGGGGLSLSLCAFSPHAGRTPTRVRPRGVREGNNVSLQVISPKKTHRVGTHGEECVGGRIGAKRKTECEQDGEKKNSTLGLLHASLHQAPGRRAHKHSSPHTHHTPRNARTVSLSKKKSKASSSLSPSIFSAPLFHSFTGAPAAGAAPPCARPPRPAWSRNRSTGPHPRWPCA